VAAASMAATAGRSAAQTAPKPASDQLPPLVVEAPKAKQKSAAKKKAVTSKSAPPQAAQSTQTESEGGAATGGKVTDNGAYGETVPGLNLNVPSPTGSRLNLTPLETPASIEVIPGQTIKERGQTSVDDAVTQNATGFTSTASPGNGWNSLGTRGFVGNSSVMRLYDGTRLYVASGTVTFPFDTWSAERIEVLRGPASVLYGEGAIGGVINVVPKRPTDFFTAEGEVAYGTDNTKRFGIGAGGPISDQLGYRIDISGLDSDGWLNQEADFSKFAVSGSVVYKPVKELKFTLSNDYGNQSPMRYLGTPLINGSIPDDIRFVNYNVHDSELNFRDNWTQLKTEWNPSDYFGIRNVAYRLTSKRHWKEVESYYYNGSGFDRWDWYEIYHDQEQIGNRFDATFRAPLGYGMKNELVVGFDVNHIDFAHTNNYSDFSDPNSDPDLVNDTVDRYNSIPKNFININGTVPVFATKTNQYSLFAEDRLEFSKELAVVLRPIRHRRRHHRQRHHA